MLRPWLAGSLVAAACVVTLPSAATARVDAGEASNFPPNQGLKLIEKDAPSWVGEPAVVTSVQTITRKRFGSVNNRFAHWVTWERPWRDTGKGEFLILRVKSAPAACRYFLSLVDAKDRTGLRRQCRSLSAADLSVYGAVSYKLVYREIRSKDHRWRVHAGDDKPVRKISGRRISEYLDRGLLPGHYDVRLQVKVGLAPHPLLGFILKAKEWIDWAKTPFEVAEGPIGWTLEQIRDELITGVVGALRTTKSIYAFDVPAIMPKLVGKKPFQAIKLLQAFQLRAKLVKTTRSGTGASKVIAQSEAPNTWLLAGTEVAVTYVDYGPSPPKPGSQSFTGEWTWTATGGGIAFVAPSRMTIVQQGSTACATWTWSGGGKAKGTVTKGVWKADWYDKFGKGKWTLTLKGNFFDGPQSISPRSGAATFTAKVEGSRTSSTPRSALNCGTMIVGP